MCVHAQTWERVYVAYSKLWTFEHLGTPVLGKEKPLSRTNPMVPEMM